MTACLQILTKELDTIFFIEQKIQASYHLQTVSSLASLIALKRNLDAELLAIAGLFHDLSFYLTHVSYLHAKKSAELTRKLLENTNLFTNEELALITTTIAYHSNKETTDDPYAEALKDADVLSKMILEPNYIPSTRIKERYLRLKKEIGS